LVGLPLAHLPLCASRPLAPGGLRPRLQPPHRHCGPAREHFRAACSGRSRDIGRPIPPH
jgi:hypothetical protein